MTSYPIESEYQVRLIPPFRPKSKSPNLALDEKPEASSATEARNDVPRNGTSSSGEMSKKTKKRKVLHDVSNKTETIAVEAATTVRKSSRIAARKGKQSDEQTKHSASRSSRAGSSTGSRSPNDSDVGSSSTRKSARISNSERKKPVAESEFQIKRPSKRRRKSEPGTFKQPSAPQLLRERAKHPKPIVAGTNCPAVHHDFPLPLGVEDIDNRHMNDVAYCRQYAKDIYSYLRSQQFKYPLEEHFLVEKQPDLNAHMRGILIDWLVEVADEYKLLPDTLYLSVTYIDRCLNCFQVDRGMLQLLGCACLLLASKFEEIYPPAVDELVYISDDTYTREQIIKTEGKVLKALDYKLNAVTIKLFLRRFQRAAHVQRDEKHLCNYLAELSLLEIEMVKFTPSLIAASALYLARLQLYPYWYGTTRLWTENLQHYTDYTVDEMARCIRELHKAQSLSGKNNLKAIYEKYSSACFENVSTLAYADVSTLPKIKPCSITRGGR